MQANLSWLQDPEIFRVNRLDAHSDHRWYADTETMVMGEETLFHSLNGRWQFRWSPCPAERPADFFREDYNLSEFGSIEVPGHLELQGYDQIQYINTMYPWDGHSDLRPPQVDMEHNPVGSYVTFFDLDEAMSGKRVCVSFQGVEKAFYLWINGEFVGYSEDSFTPSDFDLTPYLREKNNRLCVEVYKNSSASWLEDQDFFRFSGIFRDVFLYAKPAVHVEDMWLKAGLLEDNTTGTLSVNLRMSEALEKLSAVLTDPAKLSVQCRVADERHTLFDEKIAFSLGEDGYICSETLNFKEITPWCHKTPALYSVTLTVCDAEGNLMEIIPYSIGFRRFEIKDRLMLLNGERILLNGVNRHEWSADRGRSVTPNDMRSDMTAMLRHNINAVRTSHYPNQTMWYQLCDQNGIYMIDEANLESHGSWQKMGKCEPSWNVPGCDPKWEACVVDRAQSMLERDKNHPAVLIWSCGNESYAGSCIMAMSNFFHKRDSSRAVHYEGVFWNREFNDISDIESRMYATPEEAAEYLSNNPEKPYILCEYMHNMGNSIGGMESYIRLAEQYEQYQGGFMWDFKDQALWHTDSYGRRVLGYGGDFGARPTDYAFSGNGLLFADGREKPTMQEVRYWYSTPEERKRQDEQNRKKAAAAQKRLADEQAERSHREAAAPPLTIVEGDVTMGVHGNGFRILFSYPEGGPVSLVRDGVEWLYRAPKSAFWRASTENDKGNGFAARSAAWMGADMLTPLTGGEVLKKSGEEFAICYRYTTTTNPQVPVEITYRVNRLGDLNVSADYHGQEGLPELPLFGIRFVTPAPVADLHWLGLSGETYPDRMLGASFGLHSEAPSDPHYLIPQEYGCHMDTLWAELCYKNSGNRRSSALQLVSGENAFAFSALPYTPHELESALHCEELPRTCRTVVSVLGAMRGVGGIQSWGADVEPAYHVDSAKDYTLEFCLRTEA